MRSNADWDVEVEYEAGEKPAYSEFFDDLIEQLEQRIAQYLAPRHGDIQIAVSRAGSDDNAVAFFVIGAPTGSVDNLTLEFAKVLKRQVEESQKED